MNLAFVSDDRFCLTPEGDYYALTRYEWLQLADLFGEELSEIRVYCRVFRSDQAPRGWTRVSLDGRVRVIALPWFRKYQVVLKVPSALLQIWIGLSSSDLVWLRVPNLYPILAFFIARCLRRPVLAWCVGDIDETAVLSYNEWPIRLSRRFYSWLTGLILRSADIAVVSSRRLGEKYCAAPKFIVANRSRVDASYFTAREPQRSLVARTILFVGRLSPEKGVATLLEAMKAVRLAVPGARLIIASDGPQRSDLEALVGRLGLREAVQFTGWVIHGEPLLQLYREADIFCLPSYSEGLPGALVEALAAGLPVVVTAAGDMPSLIDGGQAGLVVPPRAPQGLAHALILLLTQPALHRQMSQNAYQVAQDNTFERQTGKVVAAVLELLQQRTRPSPRNVSVRHAL